MNSIDFIAPLVTFFGGVVILAVARVFGDRERDRREQDFLDVITKWREAIDEARSAALADELDADLAALSAGRDLPVRRPEAGL